MTYSAAKNFLRLGQSKDWEIEKTIRICGRLAEAARRGALDEALGAWMNWLRSLGQPASLGSVSFRDSDFQVMCHFSEACGDACMALYAAFISVSNEPQVEAAGFFRPEETSVHYLRIGKPEELAVDLWPSETS